MAETLRELPPLTSSGFWPELKAVQEGRVVLVDGNQMFNRCGTVGVRHAADYTLADAWWTLQNGYETQVTERQQC